MANSLGSSSLGKLSNQSRLMMALSMAGAITIMEVVGGVFSNSLALLGDAGHVLMDALALALSLMAIRMAGRPHTTSLTYGYHRVEVLAALTNGAALAGISFYILYEAYRRLLEPPEVKGPLLLTVALIGFAGNLFMMFLLKGGSGESLNVKGAFLHVAGDTFSSVGVILGGTMVILTGVLVVDPIIGALIGGLILKNSVCLIKESIGILLEAAPTRINIKEVAKEAKKIKGVKDVHHLHVWTITSGLHALSGHLVVDCKTIGEGSEIVSLVDKVLKEKFRIWHSTLQLECEGATAIKLKEGHE